MSDATRVIKGIEEFIAGVREDSSAWNPKEPKWFRGEPKSTTAHQSSGAASWIPPLANP
jgi:hypothetical protein